ncbi:hypothetical protein GCM10020254_71680 [Streptomyces goshikiensis]
MLRHADIQDRAVPGPAPTLTRATLLVLCACVLVAQAMVAAVNLLIPQLAASTLHPTPGQLLWAVDAYVIVFAALLIPAGALGDRYGRKGALMSGLGLFAAGGAVSALATTPAVLIAGRGLCGAGAALIMPATMSILVHLSPPERRAQALATWTLTIGLGGLTGNIGGGLAGQYLTWRALFWAVVPLGGLLALIVARTVPRTPSRSDASVDPVGAALLAGALLAVVYGIIEGPGFGWGSVRVLSAFGAGAALLAAFTLYALRAAAPLLDPRIFRSPKLRAGTLGIGTGFFGLFALFYVNPPVPPVRQGLLPRYGRAGDHPGDHGPGRDAQAGRPAGAADRAEAAGRRRARHGRRGAAAALHGRQGHPVPRVRRLPAGDVRRGRAERALADPDRGRRAAGPPGGPGLRAEHRRPRDRRRAGRGGVRHGAGLPLPR